MSFLAVKYFLQTAKFMLNFLKEYSSAISMNELVILDFETTGLSPEYARVIEVGAIVIKEQKVIANISQLLDPGFSIPHFITDLTGITNKMVRDQPTPEKFMPILKKFIGDKEIIAHNASFDQKFLNAEMKNIGENIKNKFLCTLKLSRRLIAAPDHKLTTLKSYLKFNIPKEHQSHRALNDVMVTFALWLHLKKHVTDRIKTTPDFNFFSKLIRQPKKNVINFLNTYATAY